MTIEQASDYNYQTGHDRPAKGRPRPNVLQRATDWPQCGPSTYSVFLGGFRAVFSITLFLIGYLQIHNYVFFSQMMMIVGV